jgi:purine-binding chemotaxis protein CheW
MSTLAAAPPTGTTMVSHSPPTQVLTFWLGEDVLGMDIRTVREIIQCGPMSSVPLMPDFLRGIINLRGSVVPVIDLNARFGRPPTRIGNKSCIVIFDAIRADERIELGLLVDAVSEVIKITAEQIEPPPEFGTSLRREFIRGIGKVGHRFVILLDPDRALDVQEMAALCESEQNLSA